MEFTCIVCPRGCTLKYENGTITGNSCPRGFEYGMAEATHPERVVTSTVACADGTRCPVRTSKPIPKDRMFDVMQVIHGLVVEKPLAVGDVIVPGILGLDADLIATGKSGRQD